MKATGGLEATTKINSSASDKQTVTDSRKWYHHRKSIVAIIVTSLVVIALALGLGLGLTIGRHDGEQDGDESEGNSNDKSTENDDDDTADKRIKGTWYPEVAAPWQISLIKPMVLPDDLIENVNIYDLDLFDNKGSTFDALHESGNKVICYFSAGSYEDWRDDADEFQADDIGAELDGWPGERWLNLSSTSVRRIMSKRIKYAADKGCDAVDPDNVDGFQNDNGLGLTASQSVSFVKFLAGEAHAHGMSVGLKNAGDIIDDVLSHVDFSVNEQCVEYGECETFAAFIDDDKPVFNIEYPEKQSLNDVICSGEGKAAGTDDFSIVIKNLNLNQTVEYCNGVTFP